MQPAPANLMATSRGVSPLSLVSDSVLMSKVASDWLDLEASIMLTCMMYVYNSGAVVTYCLLHDQSATSNILFAHFQKL